MKSWKLKKTRQCRHCPWRRSTNPEDIPNGYDRLAHYALKKTVTDDVPVEEQISSLNSGKEQFAMACHESTNSDSYYCIGWLVNQLNQGNNIYLRIKMISCQNAREIETFGDQHENFEDTLGE